MSLFSHSASASYENQERCSLFAELWLHMRTKSAALYLPSFGFIWEPRLLSLRPFRLDKLRFLRLDQFRVDLFERKFGTRIMRWTEPAPTFSAATLEHALQFELHICVGPFPTDFGGKWNTQYVLLLYLYGSTLEKERIIKLSKRKDAAAVLSLLSDESLNQSE